MIRPNDHRRWSFDLLNASVGGASLMVAYKVQVEIRIPVEEVLQGKKLMAHGFDGAWS